MVTSCWTVRRVIWRAIRGCAKPIWERRPCSSFYSQAVVLSAAKYLIAACPGMRSFAALRMTAGGISIMAKSGWQVGIDIGGTFTDLVALLPSTGEIRSIKVPTQRNDPVASILAALAAAGLVSEEVDDLIHGTTLVTNAIVGDPGEPVALVAPRRCEDVLDIGRGGRQHLYRLDLPPRRASQVPPERRFGLAERVDHTGATVLAPDSAALADAVAPVTATGVESAAVSLMHAYANPAHERAVGEALAASLPFVSLSHEVNPETREFERTATTVLNASVMPIAARYLDRLQREVKGARLHVMH